jgi:hypothetical protein
LNLYKPILAKRNTPKIGCKINLMQAGRTGGAGGDVLHIELPAQAVGELLRYDAADDVDRPARRKRNDHTHRARRIGLRPGGARAGRKSREAAGETEELTPCKPVSKCHGRASGGVLSHGRIHDGVAAMNGKFCATCPKPHLDANAELRRT